ncbi:MAG: protein kinase [Gammaproteobacteria bacterium]|nr:protein kinase [Gammaproteobacteria bacterium]
MSVINIPGYKIIKTLGVGGQATVYLAIQQGFDREIALKVMSPALAADPSFGERFIREAKIVAKLRHPGIVTVFDVGEHDGFYYLAMEYLPETDLRQRITQGMKAKDALQVIEQVARALHYAHEQGYIHRDVKSENILFNDHNEAVLTDFGIAKASNSSTQMTQQGKLIGTPQYMSPEQCRGRTLDGRADIYSLGIILYEMLTQEVPFDGEDSVAVCLQHVTKPVPKLSARQQHYQWLLDKMLAKKAADRFDSGLQLADEVARFLAGDISLSQAKTVVGDSDQSLRAERDNNFQDFFNDEPIAAEARTPTITESSDGKGKWWVMLLLLGGLGGLGYWQQDKWLPSAKQWLAEMTGPAATTPTEPESKAQPNVAGAEPADADAEKIARKAQIAKLIAEADSLLPLPELSPEQMGLVLQNYSRVLLLQDDHPKATAAQPQAIAKAVSLAKQQLSEGNPERFNAYREAIASVAPEHPVLADLDRFANDLTAQQQAQSAELAQIQTYLTQADDAAQRGDLAAPEENNAWYWYSQVLLITPNHEAAMRGRQQVVDQLVSRAQSALINQQLTTAKTAINHLLTLAPQNEELPALESRYREIASEIEQREKLAQQAAARKKAEQERQQMLADPLTQLKIQSKLDSARSAYTELRLVTPEGDNALAKYREVLAIDAAHAQALEGVKLVQQKLVEQIRTAMQNSDKAEATAWLAKLKAFFPDHPDIPVLAQQIEELDIILEVEVKDEPAAVSI